MVMRKLARNRNVSKGTSSIKNATVGKNILLRKVLSKYSAQTKTRAFKKGFSNAIDTLRYQSTINSVSRANAISIKQAMTVHTFLSFFLGNRAKKYYSTKFLFISIESFS